MSESEILLHIELGWRPEQVASAKYRCNKCGKTMFRESEKRWIKSWCVASDCYSRLYLVDWKNDENANSSKKLAAEKPKRKHAKQKRKAI